MKMQYIRDEEENYEERHNKLVCSICSLSFCKVNWLNVLSLLNAINH